VLGSALAALVIAATLGTPEEAGVAVEIVRGRCVRCELPFRLLEVQFPAGNAGWATAYVINETEDHAGEVSTVLETRDGGRTWRPRKQFRMSGLDMEPAIAFLDAKTGWIAWSEVTAEDRMVRTEDGGRTWRELDAASPGMWVDLRFFDRSAGAGTVSTIHGARFCRTRDGGRTWEDQPLPLRYPDVMFFLTPLAGWIGGTTHVLRTVDGGAHWDEAELPVGSADSLHDLFFADASHGWLVLWTGDDRGRLLQTEDGGHRWKVVAMPPSADWIDAVRFVAPQLGAVFRGSAALVTRDGGASWQRVALPDSVRRCDVIRREIWCTSKMDIFRVRFSPSAPGGAPADP